jgi:hypothetical protein
MVHLLLESGLPYNGGLSPGAQTERQGDAGPVRRLLGGMSLTGRRFVKSLETSYPTAKGLTSSKAPF